MFACVNELCTLYGQKGQDNLTMRKTYGKDGIRYLRCRCCGAEFSELKNTALWKTKVSEEKTVAVAEHLAEGCSLTATARLAKVHPRVVQQLNERAGHDAEAFQDERARHLEVIAVEAWVCPGQKPATMGSGSHRPCEQACDLARSRSSR
jgi:transposase-like protein